MHIFILRLLPIFVLASTYFSTINASDSFEDADINSQKEILYVRSEDFQNTSGFSTRNTNSYCLQCENGHEWVENVENFEDISSFHRKCGSKVLSIEEHIVSTFMFTCEMGHTFCGNSPSNRLPKIHESPNCQSPIIDSKKLF